ncbi:MAG: 1,4-dihydroxy-6-naphthoate synthase [Chitinophagaceae bacterium]
MRLTIGFSPCPNDTFIFDALINKNIDSGGLELEPVLADVQTLNEWALIGKLDVTKISYGVLPLLLANYQVLSSGGALGKGVGPLLIAQKHLSREEIIRGRIGIPGANTTAHLLFSLAYPEAKNKKFVVFSELEQAVIDGSIDAAVIIHENRFTYQNKGLVKLADLGVYWENETNSPIPLGGIVTRREYSEALKVQLNDLVKSSVQYSLQRYPVITEYVKMHSQELEEQVMRSHIDLYVNDYSVALKDDGKDAVENLMKVYQRVNHSSVDFSDIFA